MPKPHLQILFVAHQHVHVLHDAPDHRHGALVAAGDVPELRAVVQVEGDHRARRLGGLHAFDDHLGGGRGQRREDAAAVEPAHARAENGLPIEIAGLQQRGGLVRAVVEDHGRADAVAAIAIDRRHVGAGDAIVLEVLVEGLDAHGPHALGDQVADRIIDHGGGDAGLQAEAIRQVRGAIELAAAHVDVAFAGFAERDDARVEAVDEGAQREEIQRPLRRNLQGFAHTL